MSEKYALHTVLINSNLSIDEAKEKAKEFIKNKTFYKMKHNKYHFRNIPKNKFENKTFKTKKIDDDISLVYGKLKKEHEHLKGSGAISNFFSPKLNYTVKAMTTLNANSFTPITSISLYRSPIKSFIDKFFNIISVGKWQELKQKYGYDKFYHLSMVITTNNKNIYIEKNEVINITSNYKTDKNTETINVNLNNKTITLNELLENTRLKIGNEDYFLYSGFGNRNCQNFIKNILNSNGLLTPDIEKWLFQDLQELVKELPQSIKKISQVATDTAATFKKLTGGEDDNNNDEYIIEDVKLIGSAKSDFNKYRVSKKQMKGGNFDPLKDGVRSIYEHDKAVYNNRKALDTIKPLIQAYTTLLTTAIGGPAGSLASNTMSSLFDKLPKTGEFKLTQDHLNELMPMMKPDWKPHKTNENGTATQIIDKNKLSSTFNQIKNVELEGDYIPVSRYGSGKKRGRPKKLI